MEDNSTDSKVLSSEELAEFSKALKDYKKTGAKQCLSILKSLSDADLSLNQLKETKIGASLSKIAKEESNDPDEKTLKEAAIQLFQKTKKREERLAQAKPTNGTNAPVEEKKPEKEEKKEMRTESDSNTANKTKEKGSNPSDVFQPMEPTIKKKPEEAKREVPNEKPKEVVKKPTPTKANVEGIDKLPFLKPDYRNFTLKSFSDALLIEYKANPAEKERQRPVANKRALDLESSLNSKTKERENDYRMEARNLSTFLLMKNNLELRKKIMDGAIDCTEFVYNKESFLNQKARTKIEEVSRRLLDASNADYSQKIIRESQLYQCRRCKSKKVSKEEKQTRSGDEPMTSFFSCIECGAGWKE